MSEKFVLHLQKDKMSGLYSMIKDNALDKGRDIPLH